MIYTDIIVELEENAIFSRNLSPGNIYYSHDYIPGSVIWGHFAGVVARKDMSLFKRYFFSDRLVFTNLYPWIDSNITALPMPHSTFACKYNPGNPKKSNIIESHGFDDYLINITSLDKECHCGAKKQKFANNFFYKTSGNYYSWSTPKSIDMHNNVDNKSQSTTKDGLYTYEVINKGQKFKGLILFDGEEKEFEKITPHIDFECSIGKGRNNGYGGSRFSSTVTLPMKEGDRIANLLHIDVCSEIRFEDDNQFSITLMSDLILKDKLNNYLTSIDEDIFCRHVLKDSFPASDFEIIRSYSEHTEIDGFNIKHQCPKNKCIAVKKGSVFYLRYKGKRHSDLSKALNLVETKGVGERRNEGFGQIAVNLKYHFENGDIR